MSLSADDAAFLDEAVAAFQTHTPNSRTPATYLNALRHGAPGSRHDITVDGTPARITIAARTTPDAGRERASFDELDAAMKAAVTDGIQPELPPEISMVVWEHQGREYRVCAPGSAPTLRRARIRRRLTALSPLPLLGAITQPLAGSATAVGIAFAPVLPPVPHPDAPPPVVRPITGEIARPPLPYSPGTVTPAAPPWATRPTAQKPTLLEFTAPDAAPSPAPAPTRSVPSPPVSSGLRAPTPVTDEPSPVIIDEPTAIATPSTEPSPEPTAEGTPVPEPTITETSIVSIEPTAMSTPLRQHRHHRPWKRRHHIRGLR